MSPDGSLRRHSSRVNPPCQLYYPLTTITLLISSSLLPISPIMSLPKLVATVHIPLASWQICRTVVGARIQVRPIDNTTAVLAIKRTGDCTHDRQARRLARRRKARRRPCRRYRDASSVDCRRQQAAEQESSDE
jgi:hypothetical protein